MNKVIVSIFCAGLLLSCSPAKSEKKDVSSALAATDQTEEEMRAELAEIDRQEKEAKALAEKTATTFSVDKQVHDFGKIKEDTENNATFRLTNTGKNPLIIKSVDASCGCTTAKKPEKPILPGKSDEIEVVFHPKIGQLNEQHKTITITANTVPETTTLDIKAFVEASK